MKIQILKNVPGSSFPANIARKLQAGAILVYPTETYYAIGCVANNAAATEAIYSIKKRASTSPLPLLAADIGQALLVGDLSPVPEGLISKFWPGPLSLVVPARAGLEPLLQNGHGKVAVRVTSSGQAASLALAAAFPLVATSANLAGKAPVKASSALDPLLLERLEASGLPGILVEGRINEPTEAPSTIVEAFIDERGRARLRLLRTGCLDAEALRAWLS